MKAPRRLFAANWYHAITWFLIFLLMLTGTPAQLALAETPVQKKRSAKAAGERAAAATNKTSKPIKRRSLSELTEPTSRHLAFSSNPSDLEIFNARLFPDPLVPMNREVLPSENLALAKALLAFKAKHNPEDISALTQFLDEHSKSRWRPALEVALGQERFETGYLTDALKYWTSAWETAKQQTGREQKAVAEQAVSDLVLLEARLGLMTSLEKHLSEIGKRPLAGSIAQKVKNARDGLWSMRHHPEISFKCGPFAVNTLAYLNSPKKSIGCSETIKRAASTAKGTNLAQLEDWSQQIGLKLQMAKRSPTAKIVVPSVMHYKVGHFCAITGEDRGRYRIQDPTFGSQGSFWLSAEAVASQTDGYFLVPEGTLPSGWQAIGRQEAETVWGKGDAAATNGSLTLSCPHTCMVCPCPEGAGTAAAAGGGMPGASAFTMNATLTISDNPLGYTGPIGPSMNIITTYNYNEGNQPATFTFTNLGPDWSINWLSYLTVDASQNITVRTRGGGYEIYNYVDSAYAPNLTSQAQIVNLGGGSYQRQLPDGSSENFTLSDGTNTYMTSVSDPQNNSVNIAFDDNYRVTSLTDASGNPATTFAYVSNTLGDAGFYNIASITDGFGRSASFGYDSTTTYLTSITDAVGNVSQFAYDPDSSFINAMTTPYGTTSFYQYVPQGGSPEYPPTGLALTFPDGSRSVIENWIGEQKETYYWDREATALYPNDPGFHNYSHCQSTRWLWDQATNTEAPVANWIRSALESPVIYSYPGETFQDYCGTSNKPTQIARQLAGFRTAATITGTATPGDILVIEVLDGFLPYGSENVSYTVQSGDTISSVAAGLSSAVNSDYSLQAFGITASASSNVVTITSQSINATGYLESTSSGATESIALATGPNPSETATLAGTVSAGDVLTVTVFDSALSGGQESINYTVQSDDTLATIAQGLTIAATADTNLQTIGMSTVWAVPTWIPSTSPVLCFQSNSPNATTYSASTSSGATETITLGTSSNGIVQQFNYQRNELGYITQSIDPMGRQKNYTYASNDIDLLEIEVPASPNNFLLGQWQYSDSSAPHRPTLYTDGSAQQTQYTYNSLAELATITDALSDTTTMSYDSGGYLTQIQGPLAGSDDVTTFTFFGYGLPETITDSEGYTKTYSYDNLNRLTNILYPDGTSDQTVYNKLDAIMRADRIGRWTQDAYDCMDRLSYEIDPLGRKTSYCWCDCGSLASLTDPSNHVTRWNHDLEGRVIEKVYADDSSIDYVYEPTTGRLASKTDALDQVTNFAYNIDDTLIQKSYANAVNATSPVTAAYDPVFPRITSKGNGWGQYAYSYNPYVTSSTPTTGGGMLASIANNVISNSTITFSYDALGRTSNRSINSSSNSTNWSYDAMSRITSEQNPLGTFSYAYVDDVSGSSKGTLRLASIGYPNGQVTNFSYYGNIGDQRLQEIRNLNPSSAMLSQFNYGYDSAGEITLWQQQQNGNSEFHNLQYDLAGQLSSDLAGSGAPQPPFGKELFYNYDPASNRKGVQSSSMQTARITGSATTGDTITVTVSDNGLSGGTESVTYTVQSGDTLSSIAAGLAAAITADTNLLALGVNAVSISNSIFIKSISSNITTYSTATSSGASESIALGIFKNGSTNVIVGGTKTTGDVLTVEVLDSALSGGSQSVTYTVGASDTLALIASGLASAVNGSSSLGALGVTATSAGPVVNIASASTNVTNYVTSLNSGATELMNVSANLNCNMTAVVGGTKTTGDTLTLDFYDAGLSGGTESVSYTVLAGDTLANIASGLTSAVNSDSNLQNIGASASSSGKVITLQSNSINQTTYRQSVSSGASETLNLLIAVNSTQTAVIGGSRTSGDTLTITTYDPGLSGGKEAVTYTVSSGDTLATIASGLASAVNADSNLAAVGVSATSVGTVVNLTSTSMNNTSYAGGTSSSATETVSLSNTTGVAQAAFNNLNELTAISAGGPIRFQASTENPVKSAVVNISQTATVGGSITAGDVLSIVVHDKGLSHPENVSYTVLSGDSTVSTATGLASAINADTTLSGLGVAATSSGAVVTITSSSVNATFYSHAVSRGATETIALGGSSSGVALVSPSEAFTANPSLAAGTNAAFVTALSGGGAATTNVRSITIGGAAGRSLTYDDNGNMTSDGINSYSWDAENRLIQINYVGSGNYSQVVYDGYGQVVKIVETTGGSVTSTKQFIRDAEDMLEERNASGSVTAQYFNLGQTLSGTNYFYSNDLLSSVRELTDASGNIQAEYAYDSYGHGTKLQGSVASDFQFGGYYFHAPSGLSWTLRRAYSSSLGRWINRDPSGELLGNNLYSYCRNNPISLIDPSGLYPHAPLYEPPTQIILVGPIAAWGALINKTYADKFGDQWPGAHTAGPGDAIRHCTWSCLNASMFGTDAAWRIGQVHEGLGNMDGQAPRDATMDQYNNMQGINASGANPDGPGTARPCECFNKCRTLYNNGSLSHF